MPLPAAAVSAVQIDTKVSEWREEGKADIVPGVLFIDEVGRFAVSLQALFPRAWWRVGGSEHLVTLESDLVVCLEADVSGCAQVGRCWMMEDLLF